MCTRGLAQAEIANLQEADEDFYLLEGPNKLVLFAV